MKSLLTVTAALLLTSLVNAQDIAEVPNAVEGPGVLEITVEFDGETNTYDAPNKATADLRKARLKTSRAKEGEDTGFVGTVNINGISYQFDKPEDVQEVLKAVQETTVLAKKAKIQWGEIGNFPEVPRANPFAENNPNDPNAKPTPQQAMAIVQQRIQMAIQREILNSRGNPIYPQRMQQIRNQEYEKAVKEGLIEPPKQPVAPQPGQPAEKPDPKPGQIQYLRALIAPTLAKGTLVEGAAPAEPKKPAE